MRNPRTTSSLSTCRYSPAIFQKRPINHGLRLVACEVTLPVLETFTSYLTGARAASADAWSEGKELLVARVVASRSWTGARESGAVFSGAEAMLYVKVDWNHKQSVKMYR